MSQMLRDKLTYALELVDGSKDNPECNSQMLWNDQHSYLRFLLVDCIRLVDLKQDIRDMANERTCQNCLNAHKPEWCGYGVNTCENFELDDWISVKDKLPAIGDRVEMLIYSGDYVKTKISSITIFDDGVCFADVSGCVFRVSSWRLLPEKEKFIFDYITNPKSIRCGHHYFAFDAISDKDLRSLASWLNEEWMSAADK